MTGAKKSPESHTEEVVIGDMLGSVSTLGTDLNTLKKEKSKQIFDIWSDQQEGRCTMPESLKSDS